MKIPKKLKICGKTVYIKFDHKDCLSNGKDGSSKYDECSIILDEAYKSNMDDQHVQQIFIHEILHHCNAILDKGSTDCDSEDYVNPLSELLYQVIQQIEG